MPVTSLNGWPVIESPASKTLARGLVPGTTRSITMRRAVLPLFLALAHDYDLWLAPIDVGVVDDAGYNYRYSHAAPGQWSNHASGTALDINWTKEGAQKSPTGIKFFSTPEHKAAVERIKKIYGIVAWGGDWHNYLDFMHWEIKPGTSVAEVNARIAYLGITPEGVRWNNWQGKRMKTPA
jgi:hypothetical protein